MIYPWERINPEKVVRVDGKLNFINLIRMQ